MACGGPARCTPSVVVNPSPEAPAPAIPTPMQPGEESQPRYPAALRFLVARQGGLLGMTPQGARRQFGFFDSSTSTYSASITSPGFLSPAPPASGLPSDGPAASVAPGAAAPER